MGMIKWGREEGVPEVGHLLDVPSGPLTGREGSTSNGSNKNDFVRTIVSFSSFFVVVVIFFKNQRAS